MNIEKFFTAYNECFGPISSKHDEAVREYVGTGIAENITWQLNRFLQEPCNPDRVEYMAYWLATERIETPRPLLRSEAWIPTYAPVIEAGTKEYFIRRYWQNERVRKNLGNLTADDAWRFCGHGLIQLTGRANTRRASIAFRTHWGMNVDFLAYPEQLLEWENAYRVMYLFTVEGWTGKGLDDFLVNGTFNYEGARRIINPDRRGKELAENAKLFESCLLEAIQ